MRKLLRLLWCAVALSWSMLAFAQDHTVTGTVKDPKDNSPLAGATILNKRTQKSAQTDDYGHYSIQATVGDVLVITHVGRKNQQLTVGSATNYSTLLAAAEADMGEVIVTAMDIKRNPRELGYSVQTVSGKTITETQRNENFVNSLQGRVAGLTITPTTGQAGASSTITLRGFNSSGLNQPLFIIDGIIIDNSTIDENANSGAGLGLASDRPNRTSDYTNRIADINPSDIETLTVLKGPEATALYGSQANSGAIVITTKKPSTNGRPELTYDDAFRTQRVNRFPTTISTFGPGTNGVASTSTFNDFGPAYPIDTKKYDNLDHFFKNGFAQSHNLAASWGTKNVGFRATGSYFNEDGTVPGNTFQKTNFKLTNFTRISKFIEITPTIAYSHNNNLKPLRGNGGYLLDLLNWPIDNDIRNWHDKNGNRILVLPGQDPSVEVDNPIFNAYHNRGRDITDRVIATLGVDLHPLNWLTVSGRFGYDVYKTDGYSRYDPQSTSQASIGGTYTDAYVLKGEQDNYYRRYDGYNHTIYLTAKKSFKDFTGTLIGGTMWQDYRTRMFAVDGTQLINPQATDSNNTVPGTRQRLLLNNFGEYNVSLFRELAYFGEFTLGYKNLVFVSYSHRFESSSVFPLKNRNYDYPGASVSIIMSDIFPSLKGRIVDFWKLRGATANTARLPDPYLNQSVFGNNFASSAVPNPNSYSFFNNNPDLAPERQRTYEGGTELDLFNNLITLDAAYYNTYCYNQISQNARSSYATGFVLNTLNAASLRNQGVEISLGITPVKKQDWNWDIRFNFNHVWSKVLTLPASIPLTNDYYNSDNFITNGARGGMVRGHSTGTITGWNYARNNAGQILINPLNGLPVVNQTFLPIGDRTPTFTLGTLNTIRYKNWNLSFLWDLKVGGDIYNGTDLYLTAIGRSLRTADRMKARVVKGVLNDGLQNTATPTANTIQITPFYNSTAYYGESTGMPDEEFVQHNVNWLRLRDITLAYLMPQSVIRKVNGLKSLSVFVTGNDLVLFTNYAGADPAVSGTSAATRGVGSFGYDYGNLPTPIQVNVGLRAGF